MPHRGSSCASTFRLPWFLLLSLSSLLLSTFAHDSVVEVEESTVKVCTKQEEEEKKYPFTFSACLLIKDDNRILPEWLAYHYTVLPLRHLIVAIDPLSATSPQPILEKFQELLGMNITIWEDKDYNDGIYQATPESCVHSKYRAHLHRQVLFYQQCLLEFKRRGNHSWTILIDTDEYATFNHYYPEEDTQETLPKVGTVTIAQYIATQQKLEESWWKKYPCINSPWLTFGSLESSDEQIALQAPNRFNPRSFRTMRFRYHEDPSTVNLGKSVVDASRYDGRSPSSCHNVMNEDCYPSSQPKINQVPLRIHHYTGIVEDFLRIGDVIFRDENVFKMRNSRINGTYSDDSIRGWLQAFVDMVGEKTALELTEQLRDWAMDNNKNISETLENGNFMFPFYNSQ